MSGFYSDWRRRDGWCGNNPRYGILTDGYGKRIEHHRQRTRGYRGNYGPEAQSWRYGRSSGYINRRDDNYGRRGRSGTPGYYNRGYARSNLSRSSSYNVPENWRRSCSPDETPPPQQPHIVRTRDSLPVEILQNNFECAGNFSDAFALTTSNSFFYKVYKVDEAGIALEVLKSDPILRSEFHEHYRTAVRVFLFCQMDAGEANDEDKVGEAQADYDIFDEIIAEKLLRAGGCQSHHQNG
ncbi:hypothetical protein BZA05DRAFT_143183 [Tricharina praecox]|uniref:uncharacterized protein n=1 Tax=Tricharina praecox TaxID=43433 RepID=UPI00221E4F00|nr:uncharacterized protein BZA05DRAFT_143183 [Tricharina praecox]KAI5845955.1 hypothetical protein BZA05DRAFT_143183 [Tricharina praecox]